jgi:hypothetical protein
VKFAEGRDFTAHQVCFWNVKLRRAEEAAKGQVPKPSGPAAVRVARVVRVATAVPAAAPLTVEVAGARVVVPRGFDGATLCAVLDALEARTAREGKR